MYCDRPWDPAVASPAVSSCSWPCSNVAFKGSFNTPVSSAPSLEVPCHLVINMGYYLFQKANITTEVGARVLHGTYPCIHTHMQGYVLHASPV